MIVWKLDEVLRVKGIKGRELARRMDIGENYLSRVRHEVPDRLSLMLLDGLCRELDCTIADLLEFRPEPGHQPIEPPKPVRKRPRMAAKGRKVATRRAPPPAVVEASEDDFGEIVAAALGAALEAQGAPAESAIERPQTRWSEEPVPEATLPATEEAPAERPDTSGSAVVRTSALGAKLGRLRQRRGS